jgi:hypothetical protein
MPAPDTWKQCVLADPTGKASNRNPLVCNQGNRGETTMAPGTYRIVRVSADPRASAFYALKLKQEEVDEIKALPSPERPLPPIEAGDFILFVASHVATRETENWTWQTFWWSPEPNRPPVAPPDVLSPPKFVSHPWNSFVSCTAYTMVTPPDDFNGTPRHCFNPYLETELFGLTDETQTKSATGVTSNCMTCHRAAAWPDNFVAEAFLLKPDNPRWFAGKTKTSFSWSMVLHDMR